MSSNIDRVAAGAVGTGALLLRHDVGPVRIAFILFIPLALALFDRLNRAPDLVACFVDQSGGVDANRLHAIQNVEQFLEMVIGFFVEIGVSRMPTTPTTAIASEVQPPSRSKSSANLPIKPASLYIQGDGSSNALSHGSTAIDAWQRISSGP